MNFFFRLTTLALALFVGGCVNYRYIPELEPSMEQLGPNQGIIVARIIDASGARNINIIDLTRQAEIGDKSNRIPTILTAKYDYRGDSTFFAGVAHTGQYSIAKFSAQYQSGEYLFVNSYEADATFGQFEVKAGEVTNLGDILYYEKASGDGVVTPIFIRLPSSEKIIADGKLNRIDLNSMPQNSWLEDGRDGERLDSMIGALTNPNRFNSRKQLDDGTLIIGAPMGVIIEISPTGELSLSGVETNHSINHIDVSVSGTLLAATEFGAIYIKETDGEWQDLSLDTSFTTTDVSFNANGDIIVYGVYPSYFEVGVMRATDNYNYEQRNTYHRNANWLNPGEAYERSPLNAFRDDTYYANAIVSRRAGQETLTLIAKVNGILTNSMTRSWEFDWNLDLLEPASHDLSLNLTGYDFVEEDNGALIGFDEWGFFSQGGFAIFDPKEEEWNELTDLHFIVCDFYPDSDSYCQAIENNDFDSPSHRRMAKSIRSEKVISSTRPLFRNLTDGLAVAFIDHTSTQQKVINEREGNDNSYENGYRWQFISTDDTGVSWSKIDFDLPSDCKNIIRYTQTDLVIACFSSSSIFRSTDDGATWIAIREQDDL